jgi:hypothetical protein
MVIRGIVGWAVVLVFVGWMSIGPSSVAQETSELPDGEGRKILQTSCLWCHDMRDVTKLKGYYNRAQWRDVIVTMVEYGAVLDSRQIDVLADYLTQHLGKR